MSPSAEPATRKPPVPRGSALAPGPGRTTEERGWLVAAGCLAAAGTAQFSRILTVNTLYDLYAGRYLARHRLPRHNVLTVAAHGAAWIDQQWLAQLVYYRAWSAGGYPAVAMVSIGLVTAGFAVLGSTMLSRGVPGVRMFAWTAGALLLCAGSYEIRAQSFGYLLFPVTLWLIVADSAQNRLVIRTWLVVPVLVLWANTHGSVLIGVGLTALYAACRGFHALATGSPRAAAGYAVLGLAAVGATVCTPYGFGVLSYYQRFAGNPDLTSRISEWRPPDPAAPSSWIFLVMVLAVGLAVAYGWQRGTRPHPVLGPLSVGLLVLALLAARNEAWFGISGSLLAAETLARAANPDRPIALTRPFRYGVTGLLACLAAASLLAVLMTTTRQYERALPRGAIAAAATFASSHPGLSILGDNYASSAMLWLDPATVGRVGFDCRIEEYTRSQLTAYFAFLLARGHGWQRITRQYQIIVVSRRSGRLVRALGSLPGWRSIYRAADGVVLVHDDTRR